MTQKEKISQLIEIVRLLTKRCKKIEMDVIQANIQFHKRVATLEFKNK